MANYPSKDLTGRTIQSVYTNILQMVSGSILVDGLGSSSLDFNTYTASYSNTSSVSTVGTSASYSITSSLANALVGLNDFFEKSDSTVVSFTTLTSHSLNLNQDLLVYVNNNPVIFTSGSNITMPDPLLAGNDYGVYATYDNQLIATYSPITGSMPMTGFNTPAGYTSTNSRLIGGFYYAHSGYSPITSLSKSRDDGGVNATASITASNGHGLVAGDYIDVTCILSTPVFTYNTINQPILSVDGDIITYASSGSAETPYVSGLQLWKLNNNGIINQYSLWDLKFRPICSDPRGMVLVDNRFWVDIWLTGNNYINEGSSKKGQRIADGENNTSYPLLSTKMGGTGANRYANCNWVTAFETVSHSEKQLLSYADFMIAAYGTHEASSFSIDAQYTCRCSNFTSKWGMEQATGVMHIWGSDLLFRWDHPTSATSTYRSRNSSSIATITTSAAHNLAVGDIITITGFSGTPGTTYNRSLVTVQSVPTTTTFTYNCVSGSTPEPTTTSSAGTISSAIPTFNYVNNIPGTRGQQYIQGPYGLVVGVYGGFWSNGANAGSRCSYWYGSVWTGYSVVGVRGRCDHIVVP